MNGKIAICALCLRGFTQKKLWESFIGKNESLFNVYMHNKWDKFLSDWEEKLHIPDKLPTAWAKVSLVRATIKMFETAIKDANNKYFILVSGDSIPLMSGQSIYSRYCTEWPNNLYSPCPGMSRNRFNKMPGDIFNKEEHYHKHHQWIGLNRETVKFIVNNDYTKYFENVFVPDENYFGAILKKFDIPFEHRMVVDACWKRPPVGFPRGLPVKYSNRWPLPMDMYIDSPAPFVRKIETEKQYTLPEEVYTYLDIEPK